jgi:hypothetical protein
MSQENANKPILKKEIEEDITEFRKRTIPQTKSSISCFNVPIWILAMILALLALTAVAFFVSTLVILLYKVKSPLFPPIRTTKCLVHCALQRLNASSTLTARRTRAKVLAHVFAALNTIMTRLQQPRARCEKAKMLRVQARLNAKHLPISNASQALVFAIAQPIFGIQLLLNVNPKSQY